MDTKVFVFKENTNIINYVMVSLENNVLLLFFKLKV